MLTGQAALTHTSVAIDTCVPRDTYFVGHNPGLFTPLVSDQPGAVLTYYDGSGTAHRYVIQGSVDVVLADGAPTPPAGTVAQFQTCICPPAEPDCPNTATGGWMRVFYASAG